MNGKKARLRRRAVARSQENTRLGRKAAGVERSAREQEFDRLTSGFRLERSEAMKAAGAAYEKVVKAAIADRKTAVQAAEAEYLEKRDKVIARLAGAEVEAA